MSHTVTSSLTCSEGAAVIGLGLNCDVLKRRVDLKRAGSQSKKGPVRR